MSQAPAVPTILEAIEASGPQFKRVERSIGAILIDAGRLTPQEAERILEVQREQGLPFGETGIRLGMLTSEDISFALSRQFGHPSVTPGKSTISEELVAAYKPSSAQGEALRALRDKLLHRWFGTAPERRSLAVISPSRGEGRSFIAANLAIVFSQLGRRTLLIDADMRNASQHRLFGVDNRAGLSAMLSGRCGPEAVQPIPALPGLHVLPAGVAPPNPPELLERDIFSESLQQLGRQFQIMLLDTPAAAETGDAHTATIRAGAALMVIRKHATRVGLARAVAHNCSQASAAVVGTVVNDF